MTTNVHILATCLDDSLMDATLLVFKTLRIGFPKANVTVWANGMSPENGVTLSKAATDNGCGVIPVDRVSHDRWIESLLAKSPEPFWVLDTDVVFFDAFPQILFPGLFLSGRFEPAFVEPWTKTHRVARLHTCLLFMDPDTIRAKMRAWMTRWHPKGFPFMPMAELIKQYYVPQGEDKPALFYDTCAGLWQALGGTPFSDTQNSTFAHLHCGTYSNRIAGALPGIVEIQQAIMNDPGLARGLTEKQNQFYKENAYAVV